MVDMQVDIKSICDVLRLLHLLILEPHELDTLFIDFLNTLETV